MSLALVLSVIFGCLGWLFGWGAGHKAGWLEARSHPLVLVYKGAH